MGPFLTHLPFNRL